MDNKDNLKKKDNLKNTDHLKLKTLANKPIIVENIGKVYPVKLSDIADIGEEIYHKYLSYFCISIDSLNIDDEAKKNMREKNVSSFLLILSQCIQDKSEGFLNIIKDGFRLFLKKELTFIPQLSGFFIGSLEELEVIISGFKSKDDLKDLEKYGFVTENNYEDFKEVLMLQNCIKSTKSEDGYNPADDKARELIEKIKKTKEEINKIKANDGKNLNLLDLVSAFCASNKNVDIVRVWDLNIFQFNDQFKRTQLVSDYEISIQSLLHGADAKKVKINHFIAKMGD